MALSIENHRLSGDGVKPFEGTTKVSGKYKPGQPDTIIVHYTASPKWQSAYNTLMNPDIKASAHILLDTDGAILQMVDFDTVCWHAGKSEYGGRKWFNNFSIGIEIVNVGPMTKDGDIYRDVYNQKYAADKVMQGQHRNDPDAGQYWHVYTQEQIQRTEELCKALIAAYPSINLILGHEEISPGRKHDPGPAFPLDQMRERLVGQKAQPTAPAPSERLNKNQIALIEADSLNFRVAPDGSAELLTDPLTRGTAVEVVEDQGEWAKVIYDLPGWVAGQYVALDNSDDDHDAEVNASTLNIRAEANGSAPTVGKPLPQGTHLQIKKKVGDWYHVTAEITGYVAKQYLKATA